MKGIIFDIDHFSVHDGAGIRTSIFLKGCSLRCQWCHSPESQIPNPEILFIASRCKNCGTCQTSCNSRAQIINENGVHFFDRAKCTSCRTCIRICPYNAMLLSGKVMSAEQVIEEASQDMIFFRNSGGGVTLTGGEVLYQPNFAIEILKGLKAYDIHTIVETSGFGEWKYLQEMQPFVDLFYYDVKVFDPILHSQFTGARNDLILENIIKLRKLTDGIVIRIPLIPGYTDDADNISSIFNFAAENDIKIVHLLPYNPSANAKYDWLGRSFTPGGLTRQDKTYLETLKGLASEKISVRVIE